MKVRSVPIGTRSWRCLVWACLPAIALVGTGGSRLQSPALAQGMFDAFGSSGDIFGAPQPQSAPTQPNASSGDETAPERRHRRKHVKRQPKDDDEKESAFGYTSMCVRTCDGYTFPVGNYRGEADRPAHEATCRAQCPDAATTLYVRPGGSDEIGDAVGADTRQSYAKLPAAFKYRSAYSQGCTCHIIGSSFRASIARDYTLRRGDVVMTKEGLKVFHGGPFPFKPSAFSPLLQSRDVARKDLAVFEAMNRARLRTNESPELTVTRARVSGKKP